jgi:acylphosphatase
MGDEAEKKDELSHLRLRIKGFVQAVGYRNYTVGHARRLGLDGWVRNRYDGTVEILISGPTIKVEEFVGLCIKGPMGAKVEDIEMRRDQPPEVKGFSRRSSY